MIMDHQAFASKFVGICASLREMVDAIQNDPSLLGALSIEDYALFSNFVKDYEWAKGN